MIVDTHCFQAGIEHYHRIRDEENYHFYIEKLNKLNEQIGGIIERENRNMTRIQKEKQLKRNSKKLDVDPLTGKPLTSQEKEAAKSTATKDRPSTAAVPNENRNSRVLSQVPTLKPLERNKMKINFQMALASKKQEEEKTGKTKKEMEQQLLANSEANKEATKTVQKNMLSQMEQMQKRLKERRMTRSKAPRATSVNISAAGLNNTLPLNFYGQPNRKDSGLEQTINQKPFLQSSSMLLVEQDLSDVKDDVNQDMENNMTSPMKSFNITRSKIDDSVSQGNRSTTTTGGGLASRIG